MRFEDLTQEQIDEKILSFQNNNKDLKGHNLYYAVTVNKDGTIADEAYGVNLMTNRGFMMTYHRDCSQNSWYNYRFMIGTGYTNDNGTTYTGHPELTDECMEEYAGICTSWTQSLGVIVTSYDDMGTTDEGVIYQVSRIGYGYFDYQRSLPTNDNPTIAGHYGGTPDGRIVNGSTVVDSRWQQDEIGWYFNITEMGGTYDGLYICRYNNGAYYYCTDGSSNPGSWVTRNVIWHFLLLDYNGNPQPLKKRYNQKLFIYVYHTAILPEKMIIDNWKDKQYLMINPEGYNRGYHDDSIHVSPISHYDNYNAWYSQNPVTDRNSYNSSTWNNGQIFTKYYNNTIYSYSGGGQPWDTDPYGTTDGVSVTYRFTSGSRLVEDHWVFVSYYLTGLTYWDYCSHNNYNTIRGDIFLVTYDELDEPEEITTEIYCNNSQSNRISDQFGETPDTSAKNGLMPIMDMETAPMYAYLYNYDTKECDIPVELYIPQNAACGQYFYAQRVLIDNLILNQMLCPDGVTRTCNAYFNPFAYKEDDPDYAGIHPGKIITRIDKTSITLFAADKYWDISTWTQFVDNANMGTQTDTNGHLLVQKKYFVAYDTSTASNRELWLTFRDEDYPKIVPHTENVDLFTLPYHGITEMIGDDAYHYFTIGNGVVKLSGEPGVGLDNTLAFDTYYHLQHASFSSLYHARQAYGKNIMFKMQNQNNMICVWDTTEESTIPSWNHQYKTLKNHFACHRYWSGDCYEDHNNGRYMILSGNSGTDDILGEHGYGITIFDNALDVEAEYPETVEDITSVITVAIPSESGYMNYTGRYPAIAMSAGEYVEVDPDDVIYGIIDCDYTRNNNNTYYFFGAVFDENKTLLYVFDKRVTPFWIRHPDAKYVRIYFTNVPSYTGSDINNAMRNPYNVWFVKNKNYGLDMPYIKDARHGICVRGSSNLMAYNDVSEGHTYLQTWCIINMSDPVDTNGDPKILQTFEIDENFIGGTFTGGIGFSHYVYLRMNDKNNNYSFWLYDTTSQELKHLASTTWNGFNDSTGNRHACFVGNDDVLCYCGAIYSNSITNDTANIGSNIYCITADDPETLRTLWSYHNTTTSLQLKTVNWGNTANPKNQLLLAAYGHDTRTSSYQRQRIVLDIGKWLKTKSWSNGQPGSYWDSRSGSGDTGNFSDGHIYAYIYKKGVIELKNGDTSRATSQISYRPLENFLPMQFTCTTKTINAFNNPIQINGKTYTFTRTNNLKAINVNLDENASNIWKQNTD